MNKITFFDVEYANSNNKSICQIGIICLDFETGDPYYPERDIYIDPEDNFSDICIKKHGITPQTVKGAPSFPIIWPEIEKYFTRAVVIGHNVSSADLDALTKTLIRYQIDMPEIYYVCTLDLAREYIPRYAVPDYGLRALCNYFNIDMNPGHNAFDDACACSDLFRQLVDSFSIDVDSHVQKYIAKQTHDFELYVESSVMRRQMAELYGVIRGVMLDSRIMPEEQSYIEQWIDNNKGFIAHKEVASITEELHAICEDGIINTNEALSIQKSIRQYLDVVSTSPVTLATQILSGIMKGILADGYISDNEALQLRQWLYDNIYLSGHYPFNRLIGVLESALLNNVITNDESVQIKETIYELLDPINSLKSNVLSIEGKHICLSGNFEYGSKQDVEAYIHARGGVVDVSVKKTTDILVIGGLECAKYAYGTYGTKAKKALAWNEKGCDIEIIKESDFICDE